MLTVSAYCSPDTVSPSPNFNEKVFPRSEDVDEELGVYFASEPHVVQFALGRNRSALPVSNTTVKVVGGVPTDIGPYHKPLACVKDRAPVAAYAACTATAKISERRFMLDEGGQIKI